MEKGALNRMIKRLNKIYPREFRKSDPFRVLIGVILSHRTTDAISWPATDRLFSKADSPRKMASMTWSEIGKLIYPVNYWPTKAKRIREVCMALTKNHGGKVPRTREELMELPGVGGKSADIVLSFGFGRPVIAVDSHVQWVSFVLGIAAKRSESPEKIREKLHALVSDRDKLILNNLFVEFGREICRTGAPRCWVCPVKDLCPYPHKRLKQPE
jgi:endonuclease-3